MKKDGIVYNTQSAIFEVTSQGMCPEVIQDVDISGTLCDMGRFNVTKTTLKFRWSGENFFYQSLPPKIFFEFKFW